MTPPAAGAEILSWLTARSRHSRGSQSHPVRVTNQQVPTDGTPTTPGAPATGAPGPCAHPQQVAGQGSWASGSTTTASSTPAPGGTTTPTEAASAPAQAPTSSGNPWTYRSSPSGQVSPAWGTPPQGPAGAAQAPGTGMGEGVPAQKRLPRTFGWKVLTGAAVAALLLGGVGGYAIGHTVAVTQIMDEIVGTSDTGGGPGGGNMPGGPDQQGTAPGTGTGTDDGTGSGDGTGTQGGTDAQGDTGSGTDFSGTGTSGTGTSRTLIGPAIPSGTDA